MPPEIEATEVEPEKPIATLGAGESIDVFDLPDVLPGAHRLMVVHSHMHRQQWNAFKTLVRTYMAEPMSMILLAPGESLDIYDLKPTT